MQAPSDTTGAAGSDITAEAIAIIEAAPGYGPLRPMEYAQALPPRAGALARVLVDQKIVEVAQKYAADDIGAGDAQARFKRLGWTAAYSGFCAGALGGFILYLGSDPATGWLRSNLGLAQSALLAVSLVSALWLVLRKPYRKWRVQRGDAEASRLRLFAHMMAGESREQPGEAPLLALQFECFHRHLFLDQRRFFARRGWQQRMTVWLWRVAGFVALVLVLASAFPQLLRLEALGLLPAAFVKFISELPFEQNHFVLAGLIGGSVQSLLAALTVMSPAQRNAAKYKEMRSLLDKYTAEKLHEVRAAAAAGERETVDQFFTQVARDLAAEATQWLVLQEVLSELAMKRLIEQQKRTL